jgi:hypothetical protein
MKEEPRKVQASMAMPARCEISAMGRMSFWCVRAAQLGRILNFCSTISRASALDALGVRAARAGQPDVGRVDAEVVHQVQQLDLALDGRLADRGRLQPVAQRLVVED